ncbi:MAG: prephenate dehydratase [Velocimicrobium sp.]
MLDLEKTREKIDGIDKEIVKLFEDRMLLAKEVAAYKIETGKAVLDKEREEIKLNTLQSLVKDDYNRYPIRELFTQIMSMSRKYQYSLIPTYSKELAFTPVDSLFIQPNTKVICFGEPASYSEQAMDNFFGNEVSAYYASTFREVMKKVHDGSMEYGVLPIENSSTGGVLDTYDLLLSYDNYIIGEHILKINQALIGLKGATIEHLKTVYSHPQGILQCATFFASHPAIEAKEYMSTSASAKKVKEDRDPSQAAIASERAAAYYNLDVIQENLNFETFNSTRFIIITNKKIYRKEASKVSLCFELPHESGTLYNMLSHFIYNNLNMTKIESRPILGSPWEYRFFVDFEGNLQEPGVKNAINGIKEEAVDLKILGNF